MTDGNLILWPSSSRSELLAATPTSSDLVHVNGSSFVAVQFKTVSLHTEKPITSSCLLEVFPVLPLKQLQCWSDWPRPFLMFSRKITECSPLSRSCACLLQEINGLTSWALWKFLSTSGLLRHKALAVVACLPVCLLGHVPWLFCMSRTVHCSWRVSQNQTGP